MSEPSEEEIRAFMEKYYPEYKDNLDLGRILYKRFARRKKNSNRFNPSRYAPSSLYQASPGMRVVVEGAVIEVSEPYHYEGCAVCKRKNCNNPNHRGRREWSSMGFRFNDGSVNEDVYVGFVIPVEDEVQYDWLKPGAIVRVYGYVKEYKGRKEIRADRIEKIKDAPEIEDSAPNNTGSGSRRSSSGIRGSTGRGSSSHVSGSSTSRNTGSIDSAVQDVLDVLDAFGRIRYDLFPTVLDRYGVSMQDMEPYIEVFEEGGRKWVRKKK